MKSITEVKRKFEDFDFYKTVKKRKIERELARQPRGKCEKCGKEYVGWCLIHPAYEKCHCGGKVKIEYPPQKKHLWPLR